MVAPGPIVCCLAMYLKSRVGSVKIQIIENINQPRKCLLSTYSLSLSKNAIVCICQKMKISKKQSSLTVFQEGVERLFSIVILQCWDTGV